MKMYEEKGANLAGKVPPKLKKQWAAQAKERGQVSKKNLAAAVRLWLELPIEVQAKLLNQAGSNLTFEFIVQEVVRQQLDAFHAALTPAQQKIVDRQLKETKVRLGQKK